jgi:tRNA U55 pseudouridine synthase TruB
MGQHMGCGAYLTALRRTEVVPFTAMSSLDEVLAAVQSS